MDFSWDSIKTGIGSAASKVGNVLDPSNARLSIAGLLKGGRRVPEAPYEKRIDFVSQNNSPVGLKDDWKVRVSVGESSGIFYNGTGDVGVLAPLKSTLGVVFPYTPTISTNFSADYSSVKPTHSNYPSFFYESSQVQEIQLSCPFTVQNYQEGQYLLATIYFFRACTKMFYGSGANAGNPPPIVFLNGYGSHYLPNVPCIVTGFTHTMPDEADYLEVPIGTAPDGPQQLGFGYDMSDATTQQPGPQITRLPTYSDIQVRLQPVYSRNRVAEFDLEKFAQGNLLDKGFI